MCNVCYLLGFLSNAHCLQPMNMAQNLNSFFGVMAVAQEVEQVVH